MPESNNHKGPLAHNVSFWIQKLIHNVSFWIQNRNWHYLSVSGSRNWHIVSVSGSTNWSIISVSGSRNFLTRNWYLTSVSGSRNWCYGSVSGSRNWSITSVSGCLAIFLLLSFIDYNGLCHSLNSTSTQPQLNSTELGLTQEWVCTPPPPTTTPPPPTPTQTQLQSQGASDCWAIMGVFHYASHLTMTFVQEDKYLYFCPRNFCYRNEEKKLKIAGNKKN